MKKDIGISREIDKLGRIVIPIEYRNTFKLKNTVEILATDEGILIRNPRYRIILADEDEQAKR